MNYCSAGEKVIVKYKFPEKEEAVYTSEGPVKITVRPITAKSYVFRGYYLEYVLDEYNPSTGILENSHRINYPSSALYIALYLEPEPIYPPFEYPLIEWGPFTDYGNKEKEGDRNYCYDQYFQITIKYSNYQGIRKKGYFNLGGSIAQISRQASKCYISRVVRDITFRPVDGKEDPLKWEINIVGNKGVSFTDFGLGEPTFIYQCGDCPSGCVRCESFKYPGYQCIPCSKFKSEIAAMRSMIRRING